MDNFGFELPEDIDPEILREIFEEDIFSGDVFPIESAE